MVAWDKKGNHGDRRSVLFLDGHVETMREDVFQRKLAEQKRTFKPAKEGKGKK
jgi:prepilin-type processing-associated H-X9-DG protein